MRPVLVATLLLAAACGGVTDRAADITGIVTSVSGRADGVTVLVESDPSTPFSGSKASVAVTSSAKITRRVPGGETAASAREITPGLTVEVWFDGPVATSYPVQGKALALRIVR